MRNGREKARERNGDNNSAVRDSDQRQLLQREGPVSGMAPGK